MNGHQAGGEMMCGRGLNNSSVSESRNNLSSHSVEGKGEMEQLLCFNYYRFLNKINVNLIV